MADNTNTTADEAREALTAIRTRLQNGVNWMMEGRKTGKGIGVADMRALIEFIDAHLEAGPDDDEFTLWATRAAGGHLGQLVDDLRVERDKLRALWLEWESGDYDGHDLLRRVRLALHGPLSRKQS